MKQINNDKNIMWSKNTAKMLAKDIFAIILRNVKTPKYILIHF